MDPSSKSIVKKTVKYRKLDSYYCLISSKQKAFNKILGKNIKIIPVLEIANGEYGELNEYLAAKISSSHYFTEKPPIEPQAAPKFACGKLTIVVNNPPELYKFNVLFRRCIIQLYRDWVSFNFVPIYQN